MERAWRKQAAEEQQEVEEQHCVGCGSETIEAPGAREVEASLQPRSSSAEPGEPVVQSFEFEVLVNAFD